MSSLQKAFYVRGPSTGHNLFLGGRSVSCHAHGWIRGTVVPTNVKTHSNIERVRKISTEKGGSKGKRPIYVSATEQHVGKTTTCLSLISGLKKRFPHSIGFIKPVGQQHVPVFSEAIGSEIRVDKDVTLIREHFQLQHIDYQHMSPVLIPKGRTT